jgi:IclR family transcriptional regulator, KDG regulon repressor
MPENPTDGYVVQPVEKALGVLAYVVECGQVVSLKSVSQALTIPKTTAFRYLQTLTRAGFLEHDTQKNRYSVGPRLSLMARTSTSIARARDLARPLLKDLVRGFEGTVNLAVKGDGTVVYLEVIDGLAGFRTKAREGDAHPLHSTALGKAILAHMPQPEAHDYLSRPLTECTGRTLIERRELERQLRQIAQSGYSIETGENEDGAMCVGAPILDERGYPLVAISLTVPLARMSTSRAMVAGRKLSQLAARISEDLGLPKAATGSTQAAFRRRPDVRPTLPA